MVEAILLRTLSVNSKIKFGKYAELTVGELINLKKIGYLWWLYYHIEGISFSDEVLNKISIFPKERIVKPGADPDGYERKIDRVAKFKCATQNLQYIKDKNRFEKDLRIKCVNHEFTMRRSLKKSVLMARNHGHF